MRGFTLVELVIVITLITVVVLLGLFMSTETLHGSLVRSDQVVIVSLLQDARSRSMSNSSQSTWGVCFSYPNYVVFKGTACTSSAAVGLVEANPLVASSSNFGSSFPVVVFTQLSGTSAPASITLVQDGKTRIISIQNEGTIVW